MEQSREQKQQYLMQEIIDKGYDAEDFQEYLFEINGAQIDLNQWTLADLKGIVEKYQMQRSADRENDSQSSPLKQDKMEAIPESGELQQDEDYSCRMKQQTSVNPKDLRNLQKMDQSGHYLEFNYQTKYQNFSQVLNCIQVPPNSLLNKDFEIKISRFQKKQGGIFEQSYVSYIVETPILGKVVERRYNDFHWLKSVLERLHPGLPVPPIAKKGKYRRYDDKHLNKRRMILEKFLNKIAQIPELKVDQLFENFLKFEDRVTFEKFKSQYKIQGPVKLSAVKNTTGKLNLAIDPKINNFLVKAQKHIIETQPMMKRIYKEHKAAAAHLQNCANVLRGISKLNEGMDAIEKTFRKDAQLKYCSSNMFTILKDSTEKLADVLDKQAKSFRSEIYSCIKYESLTMLNSLDCFDKLKSYKQQYLQAKNSLFKKKERLFEEGNRAKWGINPPPSGKIDKIQAIKQMLPKETEDLAKLRVKYALRNFQTFQEINRHYVKNNVHIARNLLMFTKLQAQLSSELMMIWVDAQTQVMGMQEGKSVEDAFIG